MVLAHTSFGDTTIIYKKFSDVVMPGMIGTFVEFGSTTDVCGISTFTSDYCWVKFKFKNFTGICGFDNFRIRKLIKKPKYLK